MNRTIECVPNFSEGRDLVKISKISSAIEGVEGVKLLNVDPGAAANRTVITFIGTPEGVVEAAFRAVKRASEVIDMRSHSGEHPRIGATDVLPLIPIEGVTLEECADMARALAKRISDELLIPTYCYEEAAYRAKFRNLATCRKGEYEALPNRLIDADEAPDFGARPLDDTIARAGATVVGARDFLIAVNFNLDTASASEASAIARVIRESGSRKGGAGTLKCCKAIGWFIEEYGVAQVSTNLTNMNVTPLHIAFEECVRVAEERGLNVTGTEIVGLVPKRVLLEAGRYFLGNSAASEEELFRVAIERMGLDTLRPYTPRERVIELIK